MTFLYIYDIIKVRIYEITCLKRHQKQGFALKKALFVKHFVDECCFFLSFQLLQGTIYSICSVNNTKSWSCNSHPTRGRKLFRNIDFFEFIWLQLTPHTGTETKTNAPFANTYTCCNSHPTRGRKHNRKCF